MTIQDVIGKLDALKPNSYTPTEKIAWLAKIEGRIFAEVIQPHENLGLITYAGYTPATAVDTELIAPTPYDELYLYGLMVQVDLHNMEMEKYNNSAALFNAAYSDFAGFWHRTYLPVQVTTHFAL